MRDGDEEENEPWEGVGEKREKRKTDRGKGVLWV